MLQTLRIENYALIDSVELEFDSGLNVLTGETGAGKSIIVGALTLVLGGRASADGVRAGAKRAKVDALFQLPSPPPRLSELLSAHEIDWEEGELLLSRVVSAEGRSKAYANGNLIPVSVQAAIGDELVDMHGQHEHQSLLKNDRQLLLLDSFSGAESKVDALGERVRALRAVEDRIAELESSDREQARRVDFMRFEAGEIDSANLQPDEETDLVSRRNLIANAEKIVSVASKAKQLLTDSTESPSAMDSLGMAASELEELAAIDEGFEAMAARARGVLTEIESLSGDLLGYTDGLEYDPSELDGLNERLSAIRALQRKYGETIEEILEYRDRIATDIDSFEHRDRHLAEMQEERKGLLAEAEKQARALSKARRSATKKLDAEVTAALQELGMEGGRFTTQIETGALMATGVDRIEFLLTANPGEALKPLRDVASGGEVSRIMLALKSVFAEADRIPALIFDEIDAGIGGAVATKVAFKLRTLARSHQTICITHLPQIAAAGLTHYHVSKDTQGDRTSTHVSRVDKGSRVEEVARLLDGTVTQLSLDHAKALLKELA